MIVTRNGVKVHRSSKCAYSHHVDCHVEGCECYCHKGKPGRLDWEPGKSYRVSARQRSHRMNLKRSG